jgi:hypothetical protein
MINEFSVSPKPQNNNAKIAVLISFLVSALIIAVSVSLEKYRGLVAVFSLVSLTVMILVYTKYISSSFCYDVFIDTDGVPLFVVRQVTGKKSVTLCRVELAGITEVKRLSKSERKKEKRDKDTLLYTYPPTLFPEHVIKLSLVGYRAKSEIIIEGSEDFAHLLDAYANEARENQKTEE